MQDYIATNQNFLLSMGRKPWLLLKSSIKNCDRLEAVTCLKSMATIVSALMDWMEKDTSMDLSSFPNWQTLYVP